jgi:hypothetical protein
MAKKKDVATATPKAAKSANPFKSVIENLPFWDFQKEKTFTGRYERMITLGEKEPFDVYICTGIHTGEQFFITASYAITKGFTAAKSEHENLDNLVFNIEFLGKTEVKGKPFNQFNIGYCTIEEFEAFQK